MIKKGIALRFEEDYSKEISFAKSLGFEFFQIWFYNGTLSVDTLSEPKEKSIKNRGFPIILHAVFDMPDYEKYGRKLLELVDYFGHKEVIIHPSCEKENINKNTVFSFKEKLETIYKELSKRDIKLYVENNSIKDVFFNSVDELRVIFDSYPDIGLLLDLAHTNNYEHLKDIVKMRFPECIHIADKRFGVDHEHIALGTGDLDFGMIFKDIIPNYNGRIILEAVDSNGDIIQSNKVIDRIFGK